MESEGEQLFLLVGQLQTYSQLVPRTTAAIIGEGIYCRLFRFRIFIKSRHFSSDKYREFMEHER